jgi:adenosylhomocysteine nucleosidase
VTPILILTGVELEARALARQLELPAWRGLGFPVFGRGAVRLAAVGLGAGLCESRFGPLADGLDVPLVISAGVCGALDPRLRSGDLVIPERVIDQDGVTHAVAVRHRELLAGASPAPWAGALYTAREVVATPGAKAALFARTGAVAVDMESAVVAARAARAGCQALVVRAVSDDAGHSMPAELARLVTPEGRLRVASALTLGVTRPAALAGALELGQRTRRALQVVARTLAAMIG